jgi:hypothetical protein
MALEEVTVALDWTPNTNHVGFYVAQARGMYRELGLAVKFVSPHSDGYKTTPAVRVAAQEASTSPLLSPLSLSPAIAPSSALVTSLHFVSGVHAAAFGLGPSETLFSYHSLPERPNLVAVATILQQDLSSIGK